MLVMSFITSKFASIVAAFTAASSKEEFKFEFDFDLEVDERRESVVSPTLKVDPGSMRREGTRGWRA